EVSEKKGTMHSQHFAFARKQLWIRCRTQSADPARTCIPPSTGFCTCGLAQRARGWQAPCPSLGDRVGQRRESALPARHVDSIQTRTSCCASNTRQRHCSFG